MSASKIAITIDRETLQKLDLLVKVQRFPNRSRTIQEALDEKIGKIERNRLAKECEKLDLIEEKEWPVY